MSFKPRHLFELRCIQRAHVIGVVTSSTTQPPGKRVLPPPRTQVRRGVGPASTQVCRGRRLFIDNTAVMSTSFGHRQHHRDERVVRSSTTRAQGSHPRHDPDERVVRSSTSPSQKKVGRGGSPKPIKSPDETHLGVLVKHMHVLKAPRANPHLQSV
ncbi:hypothetical protein ACEPAF_9333 [Sanghuangporus sanghuang]